MAVIERSREDAPNRVICPDMDGCPLLFVYSPKVITPDHLFKELLTSLESTEEKEENRAMNILIVGSGPAGLSAAIEASNQGIPTTIFDRVRTSGELGGTPRMKIPPQRIAHEYLDQIIGSLIKRKTRFELAQTLGTSAHLEELVDHYSHILIATGAELPRPLGEIPIENPNILTAGEYLEAYKARKRDDLHSSLPLGGKSILILGSGYTGLDVLAMAQEEGAREVVIADRENLGLLLSGNSKKFPKETQYTTEQLGSYGYRMESILESIEIRPDGKLLVNFSDGGIHVCDVLINSTGFLGLDAVRSGIHERFVNILPNGCIRPKVNGSNHPRPYQSQDLPNVYYIGDAFHGAWDIQAAIRTGRECVQRLRT